MLQGGWGRVSAFGLLHHPQKKVGVKVRVVFGLGLHWDIHRSAIAGSAGSLAQLQLIIYLSWLELGKLYQLIERVFVCFLCLVLV